MNTKKIEKFLLDYFGFKSNQELIESVDDQISAIQQLECEGLISFSFEERQNDCDYYITAETGVDIKSIGFCGIVFDYNVKLYDDEKLENFINNMKYYEETAIKIINKFKKIKV